MIEIVPFRTLDTEQLRQAAIVLIDALAHVPAAWKTMAEAQDEIDLRRNSADWSGFAAIDGGAVVGWAGGLGGTYEHGWELHPLVVAPGHQRRGIGSRLVGAVEHAARSKGIVTLFAGSDDDFGGTNVFGTDILADIPTAIRDLAPTRGHPLTFYKKIGFTVVGFFPDVNGIGKHDIFLAKRV